MPYGDANGRHIGILPDDPNGLATLRRLHDNGFMTITAEAYEALIVDAEPDVFIPRLIAADGRLPPELLVHDLLTGFAKPQRAAPRPRPTLTEIST